MTNVELMREENITLDKFWDIANDLFYHEGSESEHRCSEDRINMLLVNYITLVCEHCEQLTTPDKEDQFYHEISDFVVNLDDYQLNLQFCIRKMLSLLTYGVDRNKFNLELEIDHLDSDVQDQINMSIMTNEKLIKIIGWILIVNYQSEKQKVLDILKEFHGFETLADVLSNYARISRNTHDKDPYVFNYSTYLELSFELCKNYEFDTSELAHISTQLLEYLFHSLKVAPKDDDILNFLKFKLLLVLNEQFMVAHFSYIAENPTHQMENRFFVKMTENSQHFQNFNEVLILNFNREEDPVIRILILKVFYLVFTTSNTCSNLYVNDLRLIIDIMIRELFNLSIVNEEALINTYLRVLYPMLLFSSIKDGRYKRESLYEVLKYLTAAEQTTETTRRLAERCLLLDFFVEPTPSPIALKPSFPQTLIRHDSSQSSIMSELESPDSPTPLPFDRTRSNSSSSSLDSKGVRRRKPPPPPPRRYNQRNGSELLLSRAKVGNK
ncbi:hypothetical protein OGAPHI_002258 [Ogataea philodendri]|uniref:SPIN90/Ldb17 leucine-rich domain-containing protein n=1 Tax=Ogataea philodendri TaxID=1378263 RepID=A0A9P8PC29_9ASCO|nr:uncharacterized protein OGAPHI_002258 [Ogataea philodendri]KAH3668504.1 hypothetical protein OGAPHI_002258 [Ogataea philodendri]